MNTLSPGRELTHSCFDQIQLYGLSFQTLIGINPEEQDTLQPVTIDLNLYLMPLKACRTDDLTQSISYATVYDQVAHLVHTHHVGLVERLAGLIAETLLKKHPALMALDVAVSKPQAPLPGPFAKAGITIHRTRADFALMTAVDLSLGANLGDCLETLKQAISLLGGHPQNHLVAVSAVYQTTPVGLLNQPDFYNLVVRLETSLDPFALLDFCQQIEQRFDRERVLRWGPRTLDIDLLTYGQLITESAQLSLPHPRMGERDFVLIPLAELDTGEVRATPDVRFACKLT